ncbi:sialate O-acetylesterase [Dyadobacter sp. NIV53]|uniref:sialate O-acetylesterase n=1 Tax=Dyadobacter sp. NIV53 TaxID=2861765 RepID=UPI001E5B08AD|nr:sialate O-acetylesterase [Dyadobacter sp. NIV53]
MFNRVGYILILLLWTTVLHAQLTITSPVNNQIIQRDTAGIAHIAITGYATIPYSKIEVHLTPFEKNPYPAKKWLFTQDQLSQGFLSAYLQAETGWYQLKLLGHRNDNTVDSATISRIGVGEVFLIAGNSNAMGLPNLGAKSTSEQVISFNTTNKTLNPENITVAPNEPMQIPAFEPINSKNHIFPSGETSWYWGELGEMLSRKWKTPVLFLNAAWAAANSENYRDAASGKDAYNLYVGKNWPNRQPYTNLVNTIRYFNSWLGMRAVLWSHGENDAQLNFTEDAYFSNIKTLLDNSRKDTGHNIPWIIAKNSVSTSLDKPYLPVINAQNRLASLKNFNTFSGPDLDTIQVPRLAHGHFENVSGGLQGLTLAATAWNRILSDSVLRAVIPLQPAYAMHTGVVPYNAFPGADFTLPYQITGKENITIQAELLNDEGKFVAIAGTGNDSPLHIKLPSNLKNGIYKIRLTGLNPVLPGSISTSFYVHKALHKIEFVNTISAEPTEKEIQISWLMAANPELKTMVVQKTTDNRNYSDLESFDPVDNETNSHIYTYSDLNTGESSIFYRIKLEYKNGETTYSTIVAVFQEGGPPDFIVFPNPVNGQQFYLRPGKPTTSFHCSLFDTRGKAHALFFTQRDVIGLIVARPFYHLPAGNYILKITTDSGSSTQTVIFN